ncbi:dimethylsulfonioproprionate lyase family protein [Mesorhizobium sp. MSK_1335]|uniref:Dimethylsulfonioproprionate lyase family protein n=1 Tax=Mesorhizobium montanum TaxID=3072323 RepID=A0ABU4ZXJ5_9HYPH|nr:dimethylsulfonioproprionate lyase family protein [Mesorhizobium sp. MSK_1335]MDX8529152.1 dimethylsulfonioproprionate lyase family protein [Mesorhizobium sp. MSK_1335]
MSAQYDLRPLARAMQEVLAKDMMTGAAPTSMLQAAIDALSVQQFGRSFASGHSLPVCRYFEDGFDASENDVVGALCGSWAAMDWMQNPNYRDRPEMQDYRADSGFCEICGPRGLIGNSATSVGFLVMGPGLFYPSHSHPAAEAYFVISGAAQWWRAGHDWQINEPGSRIYHSPHQEHAMRTLDAPLLALYVWSGDLVTLPVVSGQPATTTYCE